MNARIAQQQAEIQNRKELAKDPKNRPIIFAQLLEKTGSRAQANKIANLLILMMSDK